MTLLMHTPSAGGIVVHDGKVLVITSKQRGTIDLPKGTIEDGESIETTALREVQEETGYRARIVKDAGNLTYDFTGRDGVEYRKTVSYFVMELIDSDEPEKNLQEGEDFENKWLTFEDAVEQLSYDDTRTMLQNALDLL